MSEDVLTDDQSHYEVSLTAGQAFLAFVLLLLSLAASFAFGLMIGRSQNDDRFATRREPAVINEATAKKPVARVTEQGVDENNDFRTPSGAKPVNAAEAVIIEENNNATVTPDKAARATTRAAALKARPETKPSASAKIPLTSVAVPHFAQILSTSDQKTAEALAAKLIDAGFSSAYVERGTTEKGGVFRVRVRFESEGEAHAAEPKLRMFSKDVWITSR